MSGILTNIKDKLSKASVNKKLYVFLVCLFLATFYWLINVLGNQYNAELKVNVVYNNQPTDRIILNDLPNYLSLNVTADGYTLLAYQFKLKKANVKIDFANYQFEDSNNKNQIRISTFISSLSKQLGEKVVVNEIYPKVVDVKLDQKMVKTLKVLPLYKLGFKNQYQLSDSITIKPNFIKVTGPKTVLDTLDFIPTRYVEIENIEGNLVEQINLDDHYLKNHFLQVKDLIVEMNISADKFTESIIKLPIDIVNQPNEYEIEIIPNSIDVKYMVPLSKLSTIKKDEFSALVNGEELTKTYKKLKVHLVKHPAFLKAITVKPAKVEYVLKRK